jgi:methylated-DNA-[protein]-cysteine S-methyltransferase
MNFMHTCIIKEKKNNTKIHPRFDEEMYEITPEDEKKLVKLSTYQQAILRLLAEVPKGKVTTYGDLAKELARRNPQWSPLASRAVGTTMRNNPCGPQIPCHRVIKSDGTVGNFRGGAEGAVKEKTEMLRSEGVMIYYGNICLKEYRHIFT